MWLEWFWLSNRVTTGAVVKCENPIVSVLKSRSFDFPRHYNSIGFNEETGDVQKGEIATRHDRGKGT